MRRIKSAVALVLGVATLLAQDSGAQGIPAREWPQLRGPALDGTAPLSAIESAFALDIEEVWRRPLGSGYSAVTVEGGVGVTAATVQGRDVVIALRVGSGETLWQFDLAPVFLGRSGSDDGPSSTPTLGGGRVFMLHPSGRLVALDLESGELSWERQLVEDFGGTLPPYGYSTMPLFVGDRVVVQAGGDDGRMLVTLSASSGELIWAAGSDAVPLEHQNPMLWSGPGGDQVVAVSPSAVAGFRLSDGALLWRHELEGRGHAGDVTVVDGRRILVHRFGEETLLMEVAEARGPDGKLPTSVAWSSRHLDRTYAIPLIYQEHVYGFDGRFLVCVDLASGELVWKSRPPGGKVISLVGGHLFVVSDEGELVAVRADPEGYRESARFGLFDPRGVMTPVTSSGDLLLVRNLREVVALRVRSQARGRDPDVRTTATGSSTPRFLSDLLDEVGAGRVEQVLAERYPDSPVIDEGRAHFLWIGDEPDVAIVGDMTHWFGERALERLAQTRVHWVSFDAPAGERWEYAFKLYDEVRLDPRNPVSIESIEGTRSVAELPGYEGLALPECEDCSRGRLESVEVPTRGTSGRSYAMSVYVPAGSHDETTRLPLIVFADGRGARELGDVSALLDTLIGSGEVQPVVAAFLELPESAWYPQSRRAVATILDRDLLPYLAEHYPVASEVSQRAFVSQRWAVDNSLAWSLESGAVGAYATQSPAIGERSIERLFDPMLDDSRVLRVRIDYGRFDQKNPDYGLDVERQSEELAILLRRHGLDVEVVESAGGANWTSWRAWLVGVFRDFFPGG